MSIENLNDDVFETAKERGLDVLLPERNQVFLDLDDDLSERIALGMCDVLMRNGVEILRREWTPSAGGHKHCVLTIDRDLSDAERIAMQACFGSDRVRELLSLLRVLLNVPRPPTVLFEVPGAERKPWQRRIVLETVELEG